MMNWWYLKAAADQDADSNGLVGVSIRQVIVKVEPSDDADQTEHESDALAGDVGVEPERIQMLEVSRHDHSYRHQNSPPQHGEQPMPSSVWESPASTIRRHP